LIKIKIIVMKNLKFVLLLILFLGILIEGVGQRVIVSDRMVAKDKMIIGEGALNDDAVLEIISTTGGVLFPRMNTAQRDALTAVTGLLCYNTDLDLYQFYDGASWQPLGVLQDGDKGDIIVSGMGSIWSIDTEVVEVGNMADGSVGTDQLIDDGVSFIKLSASMIITEVEGIPGNDNDISIPTSAAVKDYVDSNVVSDGDKGEIVVSGGGLNWVIDLDVVEQGNMVDNSIGSNELIDGSVLFSKLAAAAIITEVEGIESSDNDVTLATNAAIIDYLERNFRVQRERTLYVSEESGDDGTAEIGNINLPYQTVGGAFGDAVAGDLVYVLKGTYSENVNLGTKDLNWYFEPNTEAGLMYWDFTAHGDIVDWTTTVIGGNFSPENAKALFETGENKNVIWINGESHTPTTIYDPICILNEGSFSGDVAVANGGGVYVNDIVGSDVRYGFLNVVEFNSYGAATGNGCSLFACEFEQQIENAFVNVNVDTYVDNGDGNMIYMNGRWRGYLCEY
jgi:hypothetical protein